MKCLALLSALLVCSAAFAAAPDGASPGELAPTHGYVFVTFPKGGTADTLMLQSLQDKHQYRLAERADSGAHAFGAWLPPGDYRIAKWNDQEAGDYPPIHVEAGRVTDLGALIQFFIGNYDIVVLPVRRPEIAHDVDATIGQYRQVLASPEPIQWTPAVTPKPIHQVQAASGLGLIVDLLLAYDHKVNTPSVNRRLHEETSVDAFLRLALSSMPPNVEQPAKDADSNLYFGADLGQVRERHADGTWSALDTGTLHGITAVQSKGDMLLAGADNGALRASSDRGITWKLLKSLPADEALVSIDYGSGRWLLSTLKQEPGTNLDSTHRALVVPIQPQTPGSLKVYVAHSDDFSDIAAIGEFPVNLRMLGGWRGSHGLMAGSFYYASAYPHLHRLSLDTMQWQTIDPPAEVFGFSASQSTGFLSAFKAMGMFSKVFVSDDHGASWKKYDAPPYVIMDVHFEDADTGWAVRSDIKAFTAVLQRYSYDKSNNRWNLVDEAPQGCVRSLRDTNDFPKFCVTSGGGILSNSDGKWTVEYSTE